MAAFDEAEVDLNHGLRNFHQLVRSTATATAALWCGSGDRVENERKYLDSAVRMWDFTKTEDMGAFELVAVFDQ